MECLPFFSLACELGCSLVGARDAGDSTASGYNPQHGAPRKNSLRVDEKPVSQELAQHSLEAFVDCGYKFVRRMFPPVLQPAFRANNGEFAWAREQIPLVVDILRRRSLAILGGELWWVRNGIPGWDLIPQRKGPPAVYPWETTRRVGELWTSFVERCATDTLAAVARYPASEDLPPDLEGRILYNLTWVSEAEFDNLSKPG